MIGELPLGLWEPQEPDAYWLLETSGGAYELRMGGYARGAVIPPCAQRLEVPVFSGCPIGWVASDDDCLLIDLGDGRLLDHSFMPNFDRDPPSYPWVVIQRISELVNDPEFDGEDPELRPIGLGPEGVSVWIGG